MCAFSVHTATATPTTAAATAGRSTPAAATAAAPCDAAAINRVPGRGTCAVTTRDSMPRVRTATSAWRTTTPSSASASKHVVICCWWLNEQCLYTAGLAFNRYTVVLRKHCNELKGLRDSGAANADNAAGQYSVSAAY